MFSSGAAAGTYLFSVVPYLLTGREIYQTGVLASVILVLAAATLLLADLSSIWLVLRTFSNLRSPQARGAIGLGLFIIFSVVTAALSYSGLLTGALPAIAWLGAVTALATLLYPGTVMGSMKAIPFWSGATPALLMLSAAPLSGAAVVTVIGGWNNVGLNPRPVTLWLLVAYGAVLLAHIAMGSQGLKAARAAVQELTRGRLSLTFWLGVVLIGVVIPFALYIIELWVPSGLMLQIGALLILVGLLLTRYCLLACGIKIPLLRDDAITATYWLSR
jgi:formate-dependent nitrite reductase membrane component NrfD